MAPTIALLVTGVDAAKEFQIFCHTLEQWHPDAALYVYTDSATDLSKIKFRGRLNIRAAMDTYKGLTRKDMEAQRGNIYDSLFKDYTYEKAAAIDWAFSTESSTIAEGVWFCDADITMLAPLPAIPTTALIALSPHGIREVDQRMYGKYNAGFLWIRDPALLAIWRAAGHGSRFFEQAALEQVAAAAAAAAAGAVGGLYEFPPQVNFGWWRMFQATEAPPAIQGRFTVHRPDKSVGLRYDGAPLQTVHTHWHEKASATGAFNAFFFAVATKFSVHKPIAALLRQIRSTA